MGQLKATILFVFTVVFFAVSCHDVVPSNDEQETKDTCFTPTVFYRYYTDLDIRNNYQILVKRFALHSTEVIDSVFVKPQGFYYDPIENLWSFEPPVFVDGCHDYEFQLQSNSKSTIFRISNLKLRRFCTFQENNPNASAVKIDSYLVNGVKFESQHIFLIACPEDRNKLNPEYPASPKINLHPIDSLENSLVVRHASKYEGISFDSLSTLIEMNTAYYQHHDTIDLNHALIACRLYNTINYYQIKDRMAVLHNNIVNAKMSSAIVEKIDGQLSIGMGYYSKRYNLYFGGAVLFAEGSYYKLRK